MDFFSLPDTDAFFPSNGSPTAILLRNGTPPSSLHALAQAGMLAVQAATELDAQGVPAFFAWTEMACGTATVANRRVWQDTPWPAMPDGDWSQAMLHPGASSLLLQNQSYQAERMAGWFLAQAPQGLLSLRWAPQQNTQSQGVFAPYPTHGLSVVGALVANGWERALDQALRRPDAPSAAELPSLLVPRPIYTRYPFASGEDAHPTRLLPLLHYAVEKDNLPTVEVLLRAGADPNALDGSGTPVFFRSKSKEVLQALLDAGARPSTKATHRVTLAQWWTDALSADTAHTLLKMANTWIQAHLSPQELLQEKLPDLMAGLGKTSLTSFRKQLKDLKISPDVEWQEHGQKWTLARRALALVLEDKPDPSKRHASLDWALASCKSLGEDLFPCARNQDLLWLTRVGDGPDATREADQKDGPLADRNRLLGLVEALAQPFPYRLHQQQTAEDNHCLWLFKLGRVLAHHGHEDIALEAWQRFDLPTSYLVENEKKKCLTLSLDRIWCHLQHGERAKAGRWLGEALWLAGGISPEQLLTKYHAWDADLKRQMDQALKENKPLPHHPYGVQIVHALQAAQHHGLALDDGDQGRRISDGFSSWEASPVMAPIVRLANQVWLDGRLSTATAPARRPRM